MRVAASGLYVVCSAPNLKIMHAQPGVAFKPACMPPERMVPRWGRQIAAACAFDKGPAVYCACVPCSIDARANCFGYKAMQPPAARRLYDKDTATQTL